MPQMSPLMWTPIILILMLLMALTSNMLPTINQMTPKKQKSNKKMKKFMW